MQNHEETAETDDLKRGNVWPQTPQGLSLDGGQAPNANSFLMVVDHIDPNALPVAVDRDEPCETSGASHHYMGHIDGQQCIDVQFQRGPRNEDGSTPGASNAAVVAIVIDRLRGFQSGPFRCRENAIALTKLEEALHWMQARARSRAQRGVLGLHKP